MWRTIVKAYDLVGRDRKWRWVILIGLALGMSLLEMLGAAVVYLLLTMVSDTTSEITLPIIGELRQVLPETAERQFLLGLIAFMAAFIVLRGLARVANRYVQSRVAHNAGMLLSARMLSVYLGWPYSQHLLKPTAELIRNGHEAVLSLVNGVILPTIRIAAEAILVAGMLILLVTLAPGATLGAVLVVGSSSALLLFVIQPRLRRLGSTRHREARASLAAFQQALFGVRDIKLFKRERFFTDRYRQSRRRVARADYGHATATELPLVVLETSLLAFILGYLGLTILRGGSPQDAVAVLGLFAYAGLRLQPSLNKIVNGLNSLRFSSAPLDSIHEDLQAVHVRQRSSTEPIAYTLRDRLRVENVDFTYQGAHANALSSVNCEVIAGQQIGICGPTGGGKSTLVDIILGLLLPQQGRVVCDGTDINLDPPSWRSLFGVVSQNVYLIDDTIRRNIAFGVPDKEIDDAALRESVEFAQLAAFIEDLPKGLDTCVGERGVRLSGGQRQRIAIARALYRRPSLIVFDEGTSALDNSTEAELMRAIDHFREERTVILVAHRLSSLRNCDQIFFVNRGTIAAAGTYIELQTTDENFRRLSGAD
jgi:ATP-binding cassette, subfamily B, bacterial PglK